MCSHTEGPVEVSRSKAEIDFIDLIEQMESMVSGAYLMVVGLGHLQVRSGREETVRTHLLDLEDKVVELRTAAHRLMPGHEA